MGQIRKEELYESCRILGIPESNVTIMNSTLLPDDPEKSWDQEIIAGILINFLETYSIDTVCFNLLNLDGRLKNDQNLKEFEKVNKFSSFSANYI